MAVLVEADNWSIAVTTWELPEWANMAAPELHIPEGYRTSLSLTAQPKVASKYWNRHHGPVHGNKYM